jgi:hypothetical protein
MALRNFLRVLLAVCLLLTIGQSHSATVTNRPASDLSGVSVLADTDYYLVTTSTNARRVPVNLANSNRTARGTWTFTGGGINASNVTADTAPLTLHGDTNAGFGFIYENFYFNGALEYQFRASRDDGSGSFALLNKAGSPAWRYNKTSGRLDLFGATLSDLGTNRLLMTGYGGLVQVVTLSGLTLSGGTLSADVGSNVVNNFYETVNFYKPVNITSNVFVNIVVVTNLYGSLTTIASNASTAQIDFSPGVGTTHYQVTNLANAITLQLTNLYLDTYGPRDAWIYFETDGTARNVTVSTNGITTGTRVSWGFNSTTNGATSFTVTNRARLNLCRNRAGVISAAYEHQQ